MGNDTGGRINRRIAEWPSSVTRGPRRLNHVYTECERLNHSIHDALHEDGRLFGQWQLFAPDASGRFTRLAWRLMRIFMSTMAFEQLQCGERRNGAAGDLYDLDGSVDMFERL